LGRRRFLPEIPQPDARGTCPTLLLFQLKLAVSVEVGHPNASWIEVSASEYFSRQGNISFFYFPPFFFQHALVA